jgi:hypothetical protein
MEFAWDLNVLSQKNLHSGYWLDTKLNITHFYF